MSIIFISEFISSQALAALKTHHQVHYEPESYQQPATLIASLQHVEGLIVRNLTQVNAELLAAAPNLKVVGRLGVGLENIDLPACAARNIKVIPATGANAESVAEYVLGAAIALGRGFLPATEQTLAGKWPRPRFSICHELAGKTLGIVGFGSIGRVVFHKAHAFGLQCVAYDPMLTGAAVEIGQQAIPLLPLNDLLASSDVISLHLPLLPATKNLFSHATLGLMKQGALLINTARGGIVDELALAEHLRSGKLGGAALDVFEGEPAKNLSHFSGLENLILSPHIAGVTVESNERVSQLIATEVNQFFRSSAI
ncbi:hydroxyacid dehydrogenase [Polynucleobacter sp. IMCC30063]|uniref:hydroxyacid dehydrogenase n=1 Tax=unclassified Polynucleobacter TaxID=2640945 RepID=UPI001F42C7C1|nr:MULTISPECIES: hydroxyacid dehydrogenase [unclassified Polynucleobacter]MCE7505564.1 hydroxyacid dehydrogenase [Polynucleobacter sp. IMCC30063]MCE7526766.1 hydroxyacid dehydrogenase [Polynucleobacter sp. IMCC 30228]